MLNGPNVKIESLSYPTYRPDPATAGQARSQDMPTVFDLDQSVPARDDIATVKQKNAELEQQIIELTTELEQLKEQMATRLAQAEEDGHGRGRNESTAQLKAEKAEVEGVRAKVGSALVEFSAEKEKYFHAVEEEVVRLSLAIAERIMHRETQMDPLLLSGAVRVALGQLRESSGVKVIVPIAEFSMWEEMLRLIPELPIRPDVEGDERMNRGDCRIETSHGSVNLGVRAQLEEIERGFFDLLEHRPGGVATPVSGTTFPAQGQRLS